MGLYTNLQPVGPPCRNIFTVEMLISCNHDWYGMCSSGCKPKEWRRLWPEGASGWKNSIHGFFQKDLPTLGLEETFIYIYIIIGKYIYTLTLHVCISIIDQFFICPEGRRLAPAIRCRFPGSCRRPATSLGGQNPRDIIGHNPSQWIKPYSEKQE